MQTISGFGGWTWWLGVAACVGCSGPEAAAGGPVDAAGDAAIEVMWADGLSDSAPSDVEPTDAAAPDGVPPDGGVSDGGGSDEAMAVDGAAVDGDAAVAADPNDAAAADAADVPASCPALLAKIAALKPALTACTAQVGCQTFEYPICNSVGCFQMPLAANADLAALESLAQQAAALSCPPFHCGCGEMPKPSYCLGGQCRSCPPDCDGSCEELKTALIKAAHANDWCSSAKDCVTLSTGLCPVGDLPCGGLWVNSYANQQNLLAIVGAYSAACGASTCKCAVPGPAACVKGKCVSL